jgi:hypothetical protein
MMAESLEAMPGSKPGEIVLYTEVTTLCSNRCGFCPIDLVQRRGFIKEEVKGRILAFLSSFPDKKFTVYPHLVGEPLYYPGLEDYIRDLSSLSNVELWLCTNGVLLDAARIQSLHDSGLRNIWYSLFYCTDAEYRKHTRSGNFSTAYENLRSLLSRSSLFKRIHIVLFGEGSAKLDAEIQGKKNVTVQLHRKIHPWRSEGRYFQEKFFFFLFSKIGKFRAKYICISIDGEVCFDWRNYNFQRPFGNICHLDRRVLMKETDSGLIDRLKYILWYQSGLSRVTRP